MDDQPNNIITFTLAPEVVHPTFNENDEPTGNLITLSVILAEAVIDGEQLSWTVTFDRDLAISYPEIIDNAMLKLRNHILKSLPDHYHDDVIHISEIARNRIIEDKDEHD